MMNMDQVTITVHQTTQTQNMKNKTQNKTTM